LRTGIDAVTMLQPVAHREPILISGHDSISARPRLAFGLPEELERRALGSSREH